MGRELGRRAATAGQGARHPRVAERPSHLLGDVDEDAHVPAEVGRELGVSKHTVYAWKAKYGGMDVSEAQEAKQLREENTRLKKLVVDLSLDKEMLKAVIAKNGWSS